MRRSNRFVAYTLTILVLIPALSVAQPPSDTVCSQSRRTLPGWYCEIDIRNTGVVQLPAFLSYMAKLFDRLDRDGDGSLNEEEYLRFADMPFSEGRVPGADALPRYSQRQFRSVDSDFNAKVSRDEFEVATKKTFESFDRNRDGRLTPDDWPLPTPFDRAPKIRPNPDGNRDGVVDIYEFVAYEGAPLMDLDQDGDNRLTLNEWLVAAANAHEHGEHPAYLRRRADMTARFHEIDTNKDGFIDMDETRAMASAKFKGMDLNNDGMLTREEWRYAYAPWARAPLH